MSFSAILSSVSRWSLYLLFALLPAFVLPWTTNALEINKQLALVVLASVALAAWLGSMLSEKRIRIRSGWVNAFPVLFLVATLGSAALSLGGYETWIGQAGQEYASVLTSVVFALLCVAVMNSATTFETRRNLLVCALLSAVVSGFVGILAAFGLAYLPFDFAHSSGFNTVGTINGFAIYLEVAMFAGLAAWALPASRIGAFPRVLVVLVSAFALVAALIADFWVLWALNVLGVALLAAIAFLRDSAFPSVRRFAFPLAILLVSLTFLFVRTPLRLDLPVVVSPSYESSWTIAKSTLSQGWPRLLFGSGPGTYAIDYAKFRPVEVNGSVFWDLRFDRSKSHVLTLLTTTGAVGLSAWFLLMLAAAACGLTRLFKGDRGSEEWGMAAAAFVGWSLLLVAHFLYSSNMTLAFLLWSFTGLLIGQACQSAREFDLGRSQRIGLVSSFAFVVVCVGILATVFVAGNRYAGEVAFAKAVKLDRAGADIAEVIGELQSAVARDEWSDVYVRNLSSALLAQARQGVSGMSAEQMTEDQRLQISNQVAAAINAAKRATDIEPNDVANWVVRGSVYRDVMSFVSGAEDFAAASFMQAIALEPSNPSHQVNLARVYLVVADRAHQLLKAEDAELAKTAEQSEVEQLAAAERALQAAIGLKSDYGPAHYYLAATYERQGRLDEAVSRLVVLRDANKTDVGIGFQLAMLYIRAQQEDLARAELERIVGVSPNYSNALWYLSVLHERNGELDRAISMAERVESINPDNASVLRRIDQLRAGQSAASMPAPVEEGSGTVVEAEPTGE